MSGSQLALLGGPFGSPPAYQIQRSLRFNSADSADLSRTPASASNRKTFTVSVWLKRSSLVSRQGILTVPVTGSLYWGVEFDSSNSIIIYDSNAGGGTDITTSAAYRDLSAWYHIVVAVDTTQATASNRVKLYVNGTQVTAFSSANYPTQNSDTYINSTSTHRIGSWVSVSTLYFNGYMTEFYLIDGQALTPSSFGQTNANTGVWEPIAYTGTYGTNGFYLNFSDNSGTTSTTLGKDYSGNGNNWTPNNFSVTAGTGNDSLVDTPTPYGTDTGAGGEVRGNYATLNPLQNALTLANGNLDNTQNGGGAYAMAKGTFGLSAGKWYWEVLITARPTLFDSRFLVGISSPTETTASYVGSTSGGYGIFGSTTVAADGFKVNNDSFTAVTGAGFTTNDVLMFAFDADAGKLWFGKNGTWLQSGAPASGTNAQFTSIPAGIYLPAISSYSGTGYISSASNNFGQRPFAYTAPSGFKALVTQNLPTPATVQPDDYFNTVLYTGNGTTQTISGVGFQPDLVWCKSRSNAYWHSLVDAVRGRAYTIFSNTTNAEFTSASDKELTAFTSDGFSLGPDFNYSINSNGATFVAWNWKANGAGSSNTAGTISSTVSANTTSGFSIVTYTGNGSAGATVGHGLGATPGMIIIKCRNNPYNWAVWQTTLGGGNNALQLNTTGAKTTAFNYWNSTNPGSSVFTLGDDNGVNQSSATYVAYCFASVAGFSAFGSYTGNSSSNGPFIYTGFRPKYLLVKISSGGNEDWAVQDTVRSPYNAATLILPPNLAESEAYYGSVPNDILSNGFKIRNATANYNTSGSTYIYAAFAENPFKYALAR